MEVGEEANKASLMTVSLPPSSSNQDNLETGLRLLENRMSKITTTTQSVESKPKSLLPKPEKTTTTKVVKLMTVPSSSSTTISAEGCSSASSMLKSTLKRMTRLSVKDQEDSQKTRSSVSSRQEKQQRSSSCLSRSKSFKENSSSSRTKETRNLSLRRPASVSRKEESSSARLMRSGTSGTLLDRKRPSSVRRRDLHIRNSRGCQTTLTKDVLNDVADDETTLEFSMYLPDLLMNNEDEVETIVSEYNEAVDVRKNRQLTLENMKLHREVEKLKSQVNENDLLKKELKAVRSKLEEEQKSRIRIEKQLDENNARVQLLFHSMDTVEQEFKSRNGDMASLEKKCADLQEKLDQAQSTIYSTKEELAKSVSNYKTLVSQYREAEVEASELHEFLQAEKCTLAEALKECELQIKELKALCDEKDYKLHTLDDRCGLLVRLQEQRHQEILTLKAQLDGVQQRAKDVILLQGAELSRATVLVSQLASKLQNLLYGHSDVPNENTLGPSRNISNFLLDFPIRDDVDEENVSLLPIQDPSQSLQNLSKAIYERKKSQESSNVETEEHTMPPLMDQISAVSILLEKYLENISNSSKGKTSPTFNSGSGHQEKEVEDAPIKVESEDDICHCDDVDKLKKVLQEKENEIVELRKNSDRLIKHRQILQSNWDQSEAEVRQIDNIYHETVNTVLRVLRSNTEIVNSNKDFCHLKLMMESDIDGGKVRQYYRIPSVEDLNANAGF